MQIENGVLFTMGQIGFDNDKYLAMQSAHIRERISKFGGKLYLDCLLYTSDAADD